MVKTAVNSIRGTMLVGPQSNIYSLITSRSLPQTRIPFKHLRRCSSLPESSCSWTRNESESSRAVSSTQSFWFMMGLRCGDHHSQSSDLLSTVMEYVTISSVFSTKIVAMLFSRVSVTFSASLPTLSRMQS